MKDVQKPDHVSLQTIVDRLRDGRFVIPDFQRDFEWEPWDVCDLIKSIFLDYYIGSLLLWKGTAENFASLSCEPIYGYTKTGSPEHIVLDGQQRLTALYYACLAPAISFPRRANRYSYFIRVDRFMGDQEDEAFDYRWDKGWAAVVADANVQFQHHIFPLSVVGESGWALATWAKGYEAYWRDAAADIAGQPGAEIAEQHAENASAFGTHLKGITEQYQIAYIELDRDLAVEKVCDIFTQINSKGVRLDAFDLINALLKPKGLQLKHMWRKAEPRLDFVDTGRMNVYVLQVMSILRQAYCSPKYLYYMLPGQQKVVRDPDGSLRKEVLVPTAADFEKRWWSAVETLEESINLLRHPHEYGAISSSYLPYVSIIPAFASLQAAADELPAHRQLDAQRKIRLWYWASVFTNRYSGSVESTAARDFQDVKAWFDDDAAEPALLQEMKVRFAALDLRRETKRGTSVYNGIFNLFVLQGAKDWMTGKVPQYGDLDDHHIVPASWGKKHLSGDLINSILNRAPLTAETNRNVISDRLPNEYLPRLIATNGEQAIHAILESHFITPEALAILLRDPFTPTDFEEFVAVRQRTLLRGIESLLIKERLGLSPDLRALDEDVERVELSLRALIRNTLGDDPALVPEHVSQKVSDRIARATSKNPGLDVDHYKTLAGKLEYFDLRELQDTVTTKALWPSFEPKFVNKETLVGKFDQLAELRNALSHNRSADEVTRKEGEAAVLWFGKVIGNGSLSHAGADG